jgi:WD40 repeat protein
VVFGPDGRILASAGEKDADGIMLWDVETHQLLGRLRLPAGQIHRSIRSLAFSPDGKTLVSLGYGQNEPAVVFWDVERQQSLDTPIEKVGYAMAFSPDGKTLVFGSSYDISLWDVATKRKITNLYDEKTRQRVSTQLGGSGLYTPDLAFSPDGKTLAAAGQGKLLYWDVARRELSRPPLKIPYYGNIAFHPNLSILAMGNWLWDVNRERIISQVSHDLESRNERGIPNLLHKAGFSRAGRILALSRGMSPFKNKAELWDASRRQFVAPPWPQPGYFISQEYDVLAVGDEKGAMTCWDISRSQPLGELPKEYNVFKMAAAFSPDGRVFAYAMADPTIRLWDVAHRQPLGQPLKGHTREVDCLAFSPDGKTLASASTGKQFLFLWDVRRQEPLGPALSNQGQHQWAVHRLAFSPDGKILAAGSSDRIVFWDPANRRLLGPLVNSHSLKQVAFSPDGHMLAAADEEGSIRLWDVARRHPLPATIKGHGNNIIALAFSKEGDTLMSVDAFGSMGFHDMRLTSWQALACQRANRNLTKAEWGQYLGGEPYRLLCPDLPEPEE